MRFLLFSSTAVPPNAPRSSMPPRAKTQAPVAMARRGTRFMCKAWKAITWKEARASKLEFYIQVLKMIFFTRKIDRSSVSAQSMIEEPWAWGDRNCKLDVVFDRRCDCMWMAS